MLEVARRHRRASASAPCSTTSRLRRRARRGRRPARPVGHRQEHAAARDRRPAGARRRQRCGSTARTSPTCPPTGGDIGLVFQDEQLFPHLDVAAQRRLRAADAAARRRPTIARARRSELLALVGLAGFGARRGRPTSAAARPSGWRWPARWRRDRRCCCSTSRSPGSTASCTTGWCVDLAALLRADRRPPPCSSPTTTTRRPPIADRTVHAAGLAS